MVEAMVCLLSTIMFGRFGLASRVVDVGCFPISFLMGWLVVSAFMDIMITAFKDLPTTWEMHTFQVGSVII